MNNIFGSEKSKDFQTGLLYQKNRVFESIYIRIWNVTEWKKNFARFLDKIRRQSKKNTAKIPF